MSRAARSAALAEARMRLLVLSRYPGQVALDILVPVIFSAMPLLLGRAVAGPASAANFAANTGTADYVPYLLIGSTVFITVNRAFWDLAYWLRYEQETGTLEAVYASPTRPLVLAAGVALYSALRSAVSGVVAYLVGCLAFGVNPFRGDVLLALVFLGVGLVPLYALGLLFASFVLRVQEAARLVMVMQWGASFLMGIFYPVAVFPPLLKAVAMAFPPTWMINGVRSAMLGVGWFFGEWYLDLAVLWVGMLLLPAVGVMVFRGAERRMLRAGGLGGF